MPNRSEGDIIESLLHSKIINRAAEGKDIKDLSFLAKQSFVTSELADLIPEITGVLKTDDGKIPRAELIQGLCLGLSTRYLLEVRVHGPEGGKNYIQWLTDTVKAYKDNSPIKKNDVKSVEKKLLNQYRRQQISRAVEDILTIQHSQYLREGDKNPKGEEVYAKKLSNNGLRGAQGTSVNTALTSPRRAGYDQVMDLLKKPSTSLYIPLISKNHAMAIAVHRSGITTRWSFYDPNIGGKSFNNYNDFRRFMDNITNRANRLLFEYSFDKNKDGKARFDVHYNLFTESRIKDYDGIWKSARNGEQDYLLRALKEQKLNFTLNKNVTGQVLDYRDGKILINIDIKKKRAIQVEVKSTNFKQATDLVIENFSKITSDPKATRVAISPGTGEGIEAKITVLDDTDDVAARSKLAELDRTKGLLFDRLSRATLFDLGAKLDGIPINQDTDFKDIKFTEYKSKITFADSLENLKALIKVPERYTAYYNDITTTHRQDPISLATLEQLLDENPGPRTLFDAAVYFGQDKRYRGRSDLKLSLGQGAPKKAQRFVAFAEGITGDFALSLDQRSAKLQNWTNLQSFAEQNGLKGAWLDDPDTVNTFGQYLKNKDGVFTLEMDNGQPLSKEQVDQLKLDIDGANIRILRALDEKHGPLSSGLTREQLFKAGAQIHGEPVDGWTNFDTDQLSLDGNELAATYAALDSTERANYLNFIHGQAKKQGVEPAELITGKGDTVKVVKKVFNKLKGIDVDDKIATSTFENINKEIDSAYKKSRRLAAGAHASGSALSALDKYGKADGAFSLVKSIGRHDQVGIVGSVGNLGNIFGGELLENLLKKASKRLLSSATASLKTFAGAAARRLGTALGKGVGVIGALATIPYDVVTGIVAPAKGLAEATGLERQDKIYTITSTSISIAGGVAFAGLALASASAAAVGGLIFAGAMLLGDAIYQGVRKVQSIEEVVKLSASERLTEGWRAFWGRPPSQGVEDKLIVARAKNSYLAASKKQIDSLLETGYYSAVATNPGNVKKRDIEQGKETAWGEEWKPVVDKDDHEHIHLYDGRREDGNHLSNYEVYVEYSNDRFDGLEGISATSGKPTNAEKPVLYLLGNGDDQGRGSRSRANHFQLEAGDKRIEGGNKDDVFSLNANASLNLGKEAYWDEAKALHAKNIGGYKYQLSAGEGNDTLNLNTDFQHSGYTGYQVDLAAGTIGIKGEDGRIKSLGSASGFENIGQQVEKATGFKTQHHFMGDEKANILFGKGHDTLEGRGGSDIYRIGELTRGDNVTIIENPLDMTRASHMTVNDVHLGTSIKAVTDWKVEGNNLVVLFNNGGQVTVQNMYAEDNGRKTRQNKLFRFITQDGFVISPNFPTELDPAVESFTDFTLTAIYNPQLDTYLAGVKDSNKKLAIDMKTNTLNRPELEQTPFGPEARGGERIDNKSRGNRFYLPHNAADIAVSFKVQATGASNSPYWAHPTGSLHLRTLIMEVTLPGHKKIEIDLKSFTGDTLTWREGDVPVEIKGDLKQTFNAIRLTTKDGYQLVLPNNLGSVAAYIGRNGSVSTTMKTVKINNLFDEKEGGLYFKSTGQSIPDANITLSDRYQLSATQGSRFTDNLVGNEQNNTFVLGDRDTATGGEGADTYVVRGKSNTHINNYDGSENPKNIKDDALVIDAQLLDVSLHQSDNDLRIEYGNNHTLVENYFATDKKGNYRNAHMYIVDNRGNQLYLTPDTDKNSLTAVAVADDKGGSLVTNSQVQTLIGGKETDYFYVAKAENSASEATLLQGGEGADSYNLNIIQGQRVIIDNRDLAGKNNTLLITTDRPIEQSDLTFTRQNQDLILSWTNVKQNQVVISDYYLSEEYQHLELTERSSVSEGGSRTLSTEELRTKASQARVAEESDYLNRSAANLIDKIAAFSTESALAGSLSSTAEAQLQPKLAISTET